jgi:ACS family glucarate transporter-like MFS transporter
MPTRTGGLRWSLIVFLIAPITFVMSLDRTAIAVTAPTIQREYGFTLFEMSVILTGFSWTYALLQVPGVWLAERLGKLSLPAMGFYASLPWVAMFVSVFATGAVADEILRRSGSVWTARVPLAIAGFVVSALALILAARAPGIPFMMVLLSVSLASIGVTQVSIWPSTQDLGRGVTGLMSGWTNFWGNAAGVAGPMLTALL